MRRDGWVYAMNEDQALQQIAAWMDSQQAHASAVTAAINRIAEAVEALELRIRKLESTVFIENN